MGGVTFGRGSDVAFGRAVDEGHEGAGDADAREAGASRGEVAAQGVVEGAGYTATAVYARTRTYEEAGTAATCRDIGFGTRGDEDWIGVCRPVRATP